MIALMLGWRDGGEQGGRGKRDEEGEVDKSMRAVSVRGSEGKEGKSSGDRFRGERGDVKERSLSYLFMWLWFVLWRQNGLSPMRRAARRRRHDRRAHVQL